MAQNTSNDVKVWDPFVRVAHWVVALGFVIAYVVDDEPLTLHVWAGYVVGALVVLRLLWGLVGPRHARFTDFVYGPRMVRRYLGDLLRFRAKRYLGHSPAGGAMALALFASLLATVVTGLFLYAAEERAGPLAGLYGGAPTSIGPAQETTRSSDLAAQENHDNEEAHESEEDARGHEGEEDEALEELHEFFANLTLWLAILHVAGVLWASVVHQENLAKAMISGRKRPLP